MSDFPTPTGEFDDDLMPHERKILTQGQPPKPKQVMPVVPVPTWSPDGGKTILPQTEADPKTGKRLLLD